MKGCVLLDTDFISKAYSSQDNGRRLIDVFMSFKDCEFYCHEKIKEELFNKKGNNINSPYHWLVQKIALGEIHSFSDGEILNRLTPHPMISCYYYCDFLKSICNVFGAKYYERYFLALNYNLPIDDFLATLAQCESRIGKNLGEKKTYILLRMLQYLHSSDEIYVFCSDDNGARRSILGALNNAVGVRCISVLSLFCELKHEGYTKVDLTPYFNSYANIFISLGQTTAKIWKANGSGTIFVPFDDILDDIFNDKYEIIQKGDLKYK